MQAERVARGRFPGHCGLIWLLLIVPGLAGAAPDPNDQALQQLLEQTRSQLRNVSQHASETAKELAVVREQLGKAEQRNRDQTDRIESLEHKVSELNQRSPQQHEYWRHTVFEDLARRLPNSEIAQVRGERLVIPTDPVFVFGTGELGAEGQDRLLPVARALVAALNTLPPDLQWRLEVGGHTDHRPLRGNARFPSNWELSAARAVAVLRFLYQQGLGKRRLVSAGYGDTAPLDEENTKAAYRRNRRVEVRLVFPD